MKYHKGWLLPLVFLAGFLSAWAMIIVDRQMLIEEQGRLQDEIDRVRIEQKVMKMIDEYNEDSLDLVEWNKEAMEEPVQQKVEKQ